MPSSIPPRSPMVTGIMIAVSTDDGSTLLCWADGGEVTIREGFPYRSLDVSARIHNARTLRTSDPTPEDFRRAREGLPQITGAHEGEIVE